MVFEEFQSKLTYKGGKETVMVNAFSRIPQVNNVYVVAWVQSLVAESGSQSYGNIRTTRTEHREFRAQCQSRVTVGMESPECRSVAAALGVSKAEGFLEGFSPKDGLLYKLGLLCVPCGSYRPQLIREAHHSKVTWHFGMKKTYAHLQRYFFWPRMQRDVKINIHAYALCCTSKPSNRKLGKYHCFLIPERPWESISMDFLAGEPTT
eukprot:Gb_31750 [translate_table: standard]